ncbi:hypothetical protein HAX54_009733 [Datura stramonium]|uniref:Serine/threonine-protein kinase TOR n=1 Tax=Datura stramonium TaxID=4076 RepID=A0ABS8RY78_DATST|nr:hypothetical protein [Datura stramonium]
MATPVQAIRYPVATTGAGNIDALNRVLADLCIRGNPKDGAALTLKRLVEEEARDLSGEAFARFMDHLYERITTFLDSNEVSENLGALRVIDELIDVTISENASKVAKLSNYMRSAFETKRDPEILVLASKVLGHLARSGGAMTADEVERQVKVALEWLRGERIEYRRFAAVLILKEMAENASTVFNVHVPEFVDAIWVALRDPTLAVREKAVEALRACLRVIEKRETRWRVQWNTGEFMMSRYREVAEIVLRYLEHRDRLVRLSITSLLTNCHFLRDRFVANYLTNVPVSSLHLQGDGWCSGWPSLEALACVGNIAKAMGPTMEPHVRGLLDCMFSAGLSLTLDRLLECISVILSRSHHAMSRQSAALSEASCNSYPQVPELSGSALVQLLCFANSCSFNFKGHSLLEFARESVVVYLEDEDGTTRKDAALGKRRRLVEEIVQKLLIAAVADADVTVRHSIFPRYADGGFGDRHPSLLLYTRLLLRGNSVRHRVNANSGIISGVLVTVGDLARVGDFLNEIDFDSSIQIFPIGERLCHAQYISELMPLIVEALLDGAAVTKREVAVSTLGQVVQSTGYVITPYNEYPQLLGLLLKLLNGELAWSALEERFW